MTGTRRAVVVIAAATALSGAGTLAVAGASRYFRSRAEPVAATAPVAGFQVLARTRTVADEIPLPGSDKIRTDPELERDGIRWDESRRALTRSGITVYVMPARTGICLFYSGAAVGTSLSCARYADAVLGRLFGRIVLDGATVVIGLAPDGVRRVGVESDVATTTEVAGNAYVVAAGRADGVLSWTGSGPGGSIALPPSGL